MAEKNKGIADEITRVLLREGYLMKIKNLKNNCKRKTISTAKQKKKTQENTTACRCEIID